LSVSGKLAFGKGPYSGLDMVLCACDCAVWNYRFKGGFKMAGWTLKTLGVGFIAGFVTAAIISGFVAVSIYSRNRDREFVNYVRENARKQIEIETLREDYGNRDPLEFLDDIPDVRGAADGAASEFNRKLDEILQRFRNRFAD